MDIAWDKVYLIWCKYKGFTHASIGRVEKCFPIVSSGLFREAGTVSSIHSHKDTRDAMIELVVYFEISAGCKNWDFY